MNIFIRKNDDDLLKYLDADEINNIKPFRKIIELNNNDINNDIIFSSGDKGKDIYLVAEGLLEIFDTNSKGKEIVIVTLYEGEIIGEVNFAISIKRHFSVRAKGKTKVICYSYKQLTDLMRKEKIIAAKINAAINDSMADKTIRITQKL